jgi:hypothetical protein
MPKQTFYLFFLNISGNGLFIIILFWDYLIHTYQMCLKQWAVPIYSNTSATHICLSYEDKFYKPFEAVRVRVRVSLRLTVSQSVSLGVEPLLGPMTRF